MHLGGKDINFGFGGGGKILILCKIYTPAKYSKSLKTSVTAGHMEGHVLAPSVLGLKAGGTQRTLEHLVCFSVGGSATAQFFEAELLFSLKRN